MAARHVPELGEGDNQDPVLALSPPRNLYRDLIRNVIVSTGQYIRLPIHTGSSYSNSSGASSSYYSQTNSSGCSSGSATTTATAGFCTYDHELTRIARQMVHDGYTGRMVKEFGTGGPDRAPLETWFLELDVDWVLQLHEERGLGPPDLHDKPASSLQDLIERWIRALTVIAVSMAELALVVSVDETPAVAGFGQASMAKMFVFVDAIIPLLKEENLQAVVDMYICVCTVSYTTESYYRSTQQRPISREAQRILREISKSLSREEFKLREAVSRRMEEVLALVEDDDLWAIDFPRGRAEVHRNTRFMVDCIMSMLKARGSMPYTRRGYFLDLIDDSVRHLKDLLLRKSELYSDPGLRYLFLLNNFNSLAQLPEPRHVDQWILTTECKMFMDSYVDVSWGHVLSHIQKTVFKDSCLDVSCGHVLSCVPKPGFHEWRQHRKKTSSLAKFESAFHKTYQAQKFWKVADPQLRNALRSTVIDRVISDYRSYLKEHPEVEEHVRSSPDVLEEMLGELFEG